jgi:hypothetical protein
MSKFNSTIKTPKSLTENLAGGQAYKQSSEMALVSLLLTSFVNDQFYRDGNKSLEDLKSILGKVNPEFAAKSCIFARDEFGMRSISHALAAELAKYLSGTEIGKSFYEKIVVRPDDMTEILAYYENNCGKKIPSAIKRGFAKSFDKFDGYQLAKWKN